MLTKQNGSFLCAVSIKNTCLSVLVLGRSSEPPVKWPQSPGASLCCNRQERLVAESHGRFLSRSTMHWSGWIQSFCRSPLDLSLVFPGSVPAILTCKWEDRGASWS